ncbi:holin [Lacticaseibacillus paracasei]|uniref:holin n=1 Tax=Lacticaseibacillus paracasei TaxID=1597 RepID=UPI0040458AE9
MQNELFQVLAIAVVIAPITTGFTEIFKRYTPADGKLLPILSIVTGILLACVWAMAFDHLPLIGAYALAGLLSGLSSIGVYQIIKPNAEVK